MINVRKIAENVSNGEKEIKLGFFDGGVLSGECVARITDKTIIESFDCDCEDILLDFFFRSVLNILIEEAKTICVCSWHDYLRQFGFVKSGNYYEVEPMAVKFESGCCHNEK